MEGSAVSVPLVRPVVLLFNSTTIICYINPIGHQYTKLNTNNIDPRSIDERNIVADSTPLNDLKTRRHVFGQQLCTQLLQYTRFLRFLYIVYVYIYSNNQNVIATEYTELLNINNSIVFTSVRHMYVCEM